MDLGVVAQPAATMHPLSLVIVALLVLCANAVPFEAICFVDQKFVSRLGIG